MKGLSIRIVILSVLFLLSSFFVYGIDRTSSTPISIKLASFPQHIGSWKTSSTQSMSKEVEDVLGVDDYLLRNYRGPNKAEINLYVSYFSYTDRSKGYHSPLNCMPGSGWNIADVKPVSIKIQKSGEKATVNKIMLQSGDKTQVSLYWYQCRGRILHNEYIERVYRVIDSIFFNRTDGAFIRLIATNEGKGIEDGSEMLRNFASEIIPLLRNHLPS